MTETIEVVELVPPEVPWDQKLPGVCCHGFMSKTHNLRLILGYNVYANGMYRLYAYEQIGTQPSQLWRSFLASPEAVVEAAENLCAECDDYLDTFSMMRRPDEDLNFDDFIQHIELRVTKMFV